MQPVAFKAEHFFDMAMQPAQTYHRDLLTLEDARTLEGEYAHSLMDGDEPMSCVGLAPFNRHCVRIWALLSDKARGGKFVEVHRWAKFYVTNLPFRRIEATAAIDFEAAKRWLPMLGFEWESTMRSFDERGVDHHLYAIVREAS